MLLVIVFGLAMLSFGCVMTLKPLQFSAAIARFSAKPWFHQFEIFSRLLMGVLLLLIADTTSYPMTIAAIGGLLCLVSVLLMVIGSRRHRAFALLTSGIGKHFRWLGVIAIVCGAGLVYLATA